MEFFILFCLIAIFGTFAYAGYKGAPWVPTRKKNLSTIIGALKLDKNSIFYDIGCGDGRLVVAAAERGAQAVGLEISLLPYLLAKWRAFRSPAKNRIQIKYKNLWNTDLSPCTHIYFFLMPEMFPKLMEKFNKELKPNTTIVSYVWPLSGLVPTQTIKRENRPTFYSYII